MMLHLNAAVMNMPLYSYDTAHEYCFGNMPLSDTTCLVMFEVHFIFSCSIGHFVK